MSTIQVRVDDDLKSKADALFKELGTDTTSAIRMFLTQAVAYGGIPFEIKKFNKTNEMKVMTEDEFLDRLASSSVQSREGKVIDADIAIDSVRNKYGL
ncbi:type II toxin-antitoxin system RelB/DinJ family antitoxin [uncultured Holdemanella sp.]|jgi:DNA-damage-inducible protein J|uniref:type II toxin-antitoxin system RelB/DinJ family antitoxin n=1 Tax=uncultured Holdemanella sp. TaxID=1763549 RepID=UPI0025D502E7|nr:type II toxin-antitoxin system RelB/DinJ family antitoxin [uncultured Holdemanella sp.]